MALIVEARYDKNAILEAYLNEIYLGQRGSTAVHGVGEAAHLYFGKPASRLSVAESGLIAAIIQSPNGISPYRDPERALRRRNLVLELMKEQGRLDPEAFAQAREEPLRLATVTPEPGDARFFLDFLHRAAHRRPTRPQQLTEEGLRIYSTLDRRLQRIAARGARGRARARSRSAAPSSRATIPRASSRAASWRSGRRPARCSRSWGAATTAPRSSIAAPRRGASPAACSSRSSTSRRSSRATTCSPRSRSRARSTTRRSRSRTPDGPWRPKNFDNEFHDQVGVREAIERSLNVATVRLARDVGLRNVVDVAQRLGIESPLPAVPSLALGTAEVSPLELARAYATLASGGVRPETQAIEDVVDPTGGVLARRELRFQRVLDRGHGLPRYFAARRSGRARHRGGRARGRSARPDRREDRHHRRRARSLVRGLHAGSRRGGVDRVRRAAQRRSRRQPRARCRSGGASSRRSRAAPCAACSRAPPRLERAEISPSGAIALAGCPEHRTEYFLPGTLPTTFCPDGESSDAEREDRVNRRTERGFFEWLRDQL